VPAEIDYKPLMRDALLKIDELQSRLSLFERAAGEPIAIVGIGCRFPGPSETPDAFWQLLQDGRSTVTEVPADRFDIGEYYDADPDAPGKIYSRHGSFLRQVDCFDASFFGISPREAAQMDPQQRLLLETAWEALERAGISPANLSGSQTAVMVGMMNNDYAQRAAQCPGAIDVHTGAGTAMSAAAGRLSYLLGLCGPSLVVDTACSSSLVSVHLACLSLRNRECDLALAGGVNVIVSPVNSVIESRTRILSPNGQCRTFDAAADGIVRGEGCGVVVLRRLSDAIAAGDPILASIRGSAVNHDGRTSGLSVPNGPAQEAVIRQALANARVTPGEVSYVEAHGTATALGDPIEAEALGNVFAGRPAAEPLLVGSVKTNLGHLEGAAGIAGLIKAVLALQHGAIPPHLHFTTPSPLIDWDALPIRVAARGVLWPRGPRPRLAGVSSFGFTGTNVHLVLEEAPLPAPQPEDAGCGRHVLPLSAHTAPALREVARRYADFARQHPDLRLADVCFTADTGRAHLSHRAAVAASSLVELADRLDAYAGGAAADGAAAIDNDEAGPLPAGRKVVLPTYPFERRRHWLDLPFPSAGHPLLGARQPSAALKNGEVVFAAEIGPRHPTFLASHRIFDVPVLPASAYIEMALSAIALSAADAAAPVLEDLRILEALPLAGGDRRLVNTVLRPGPAGRYAFEVQSWDPETGAWTLHAAGKLAPGKPQLAPGKPYRAAAPGLAMLRAQCDEPVEIAAHYDRCRQSGLEYGADFRTLERLWKGPGAAVAEAALPESCRAQAAAYLIHPALLDACLHVFLAAFPDQPGDATYLPVAIERVTLYRRAAERLWSYGRIRPYRTGDETFRADIRLLDSDGSLVGEVEGLTVRTTRRDAVRQAIERSSGGLCYSIAWHAAPPPLSEAPVSGPWLISAGPDDCGRRLADSLREQGAECILISAGGIDDGLLSGRAAGVRGIVYLWSPDTVAGCGGVLRLLQAVARAGRRDAPKLWVVTRGAQPVKGSEPIDAWQAPVWGLLRTAAMEHPEIDIVACDLDPDAGADPVAALQIELRAADAERHVAWRGGVRYAARIQRSTTPVERGAAPAIRAAASYLVTGGLGGLGLLTADWLVRRGARHLVLLGRSAPDLHAAREIARFERAGTSVAVVRCDVADAEALARVLSGIDPALAGVAHCAGCLEDAVLTNQHEESFRRVLAAKVAGSWNLHVETLAMGLDFFVGFSSAASITGARGQANYAAANAFLDALAHHRRALGLPGISVNWGSWPDVGMTARARAGASTVPGLGTISPGQAFSLLERLLGQGTPQAGVFAMDWPKFLASLPWLGKVPFFAECQPASCLASAKFRSELERQRPEAWLDLIEAHVAAGTARALGLETASEVDRKARLFDLGLDSLMAVELRNNLAATLGCSLRSTVVFDYPTVELLALHLVETLSGRPNGASPQAPANDMLDAVRQLSDDDIELLVDEELRVLGKGGGA
jgi:acyl transferase domain-containing protein